MLDTLDARLAQARAGDLGHLEFLQVLCEDEIARRDAAAVIRRVRPPASSRPPPSRTSTSPTTPTIPAADDPRPRHPALRRRQGESVILHGPVGVGKTFIAQALGHHACRHGHTRRRSPRPADCSPTSPAATPTTPGPPGCAAGPDPTLLILDDFAMRDFTAAQADDLYELITERAGRPLVLTSNRRPEDWYPLFPNPVVAESILDRLINTAHHIPWTAAATGPTNAPTAEPPPRREPPPTRKPQGPTAGFRRHTPAE